MRLEQGIALMGSIMVRQWSANYSGIPTAATGIVQGEHIDTHYG
jgi:hypothetical protein